jgi:hypothetical protein
VSEPFSLDTLKAAINKIREVQEWREPIYIVSPKSYAYLQEHGVDMGNLRPSGNVPANTAYRLSGPLLDHLPPRTPAPPT